jgi:hypothetical protein
MRQAVLALALALLTGGAWAQQPAPAPGAPAEAPAVVKPTWNELTPSQKQILGPLAPEWDTMDARRKQKWLDISARMATRSPEEQARLQERMREWVKLTPEERRLARENYARAGHLERSHRSAKWEQYQQLPEEEKRRLAEEARARRNAANVPPRDLARPLPPVKKGPPPCPPGLMPNPAGPTPPCVTPPPGSTPPPPPNAKQ